MVQPIPRKLATSEGALVALPLAHRTGCETSTASAIHPNQRFIYSTTDAGAFGNVCGFVLNHDAKTLTAIPGSPVRAGGGTRAPVIDPSGTFLYAVNFDDNTLVGFAIDPATGALSALPGSPYPTGPSPLAAAMDPTGHFVYVVNSNINTVAGSISGFAIDQDTGALTSLPGSPYATPARALAIAAEPYGKYLYVAGNVNQAYAIDPQTGALTAIGAGITPFASTVAVDPSGRFVYIAESFANRITPYAIGPTGTLTAIGPGVSTGANPLGMAVTVSGRFLYVANLISSDVSGFAIDPDTGNLTPLAGFPQPAGENPFGLTAGGVMPNRVAAPVGARFFYPLGVVGGYPPYRWSLAGGSLPPGLSINAILGGLEGKPTTPGQYAFTAQAIDNRGAVVTKSYRFDVLTQAAANAPAAVEFYNATLGNFFITANSEEALSVDIGNSGPGWVRTGERFPVGGSTQVCRFYGSISPGPNSHFYTIDANECQQLKDLQATTPAAQKRWNFESLDFASTPAANGGCAVGLLPVYRAYNNGFARGIDSNHRITASLAAIGEVVSMGWIDEGIVMCAPAP
ncbi:MAG: beta-propeller fold lactonase family protein [Betaproteobacteria bacterium]|nr:beta-propeller fold lactonase family protein [Betaproteobacteria bacterium]